MNSIVPKPQLLRAARGIHLAGEAIQLSALYLVCSAHTLLLCTHVYEDNPVYMYQSASYAPLRCGMQFPRSSLGNIQGTPVNGLLAGSPDSSPSPLGP